MTINAFTLLTQIQECFSQETYPGEDHIVFDNTGNNLECEAIKSVLKGHYWQDISLEMLDQLNSALFFLSPEGYRFYLPTFISYSISNFYDIDVIPDEVIQTLTLPSKLDVERIAELAKLHPEIQPFRNTEWRQILETIASSYRNGTPGKIFFERVSGFNTEQCKVIKIFLEYIQEVYGKEFPNGEPQIAIDRYWFRF